MQTHRLPELIETLGEDALSLAEGTAEGVDAAGAVLWGATKEAVFWAAERVLRQALAPVHEYRTSAKRVQAALDAQLGALPAGKGKGKEDSPSVEEGVRQHGSRCSRLKLSNHIKNEVLRICTSASSSRSGGVCYVKSEASVRGGNTPLAFSLFLMPSFLALLPLA